MRAHPSGVRPQMRVFRCPVCGQLHTAPKVLGRTHEGHIKTMWCFVCKQVVDQVQVE